MKMNAHAEFVTLSDSLTSPRPKPKPKSKDAGAGAAEVLCLDSDTESDGSYAQTFIKGLPGNTAERDETGCSPDVYKQSNDSWIGLRKCSSYQKSWSPSHSLALEKVTDVGAHGSCNGMDQSENGRCALDSHLVVNRKPSLDIAPLIQSDNLHSLQTVPWSDLECKPDADDKTAQPSKCNTDINLGMIVSPCASLEQGIYFDNFDTYSNSMCSASPSPEVKSPLMLCANTHSVDAPANHGACLSSPSQELNDYTLFAWDDHLKRISCKLESTKATTTTVKSQTFWRSNSKSSEKRTNAEFDELVDDDDMDSGEHSCLKKLSWSTGKRDVGDISATEDGSTCKRRRRGLKGDSGEANSKPAGKTKDGCKSRTVCRTAVRDDADASRVLGKDEEKLSKKEKQMKDREDREAKKQQLKEERAVLRQQKQEEKKRLQEMKKQRNEDEKKRKEELKSKALERRKVEKEREKWEKGKFALQNITALVDTRIVEQGLIGGLLLTRLAEKCFKYHLVKNPVKKTVIWQIKLPSEESVLEVQEDCQSQDSQDSQDLKSCTDLGSQFPLKSKSIPYVLIVLEAEEFLEMITGGGLDKHVRNLQKLYPGCTICYLINKLMRHLHKREQQQYKNPGDTWTRPPVEQVLAKLVTSYGGVHSRVCVDEAEVCEHIVGLTRSLAECAFKRKLSPLSVSANGDHLVKNDPNNEAIRKDVWLKALVAIPKVSGACAVAIAKQYPCMNALFEAYLDPRKTVHEKEHLLQDLLKEGLMGPESSRRIGPACSRRVYRILMAEQGNLYTDDVEEGADAFKG